MAVPNHITCPRNKGTGSETLHTKAGGWNDWLSTTHSIHYKPWLTNGTHTFWGINRYHKQNPSQNNCNSQGPFWVLPGPSHASKSSTARTLRLPHRWSPTVANDRLHKCFESIGKQLESSALRTQDCCMVSLASCRNKNTYTHLHTPIRFRRDLPKNGSIIVI